MTSEATQEYRLTWATDIHLNCLKRPRTCEKFGQYLREKTSANGYLFTGDLSEAPFVALQLLLVERGLQKPPFFVLGNHDYYGGSFATVEQEIAQFPGWLDHGKIHELTPGVALVGCEGWYDAVLGDPMSKNFGMSDWLHIRDLASLPGNPFAVQRPFDQRMFKELMLDQLARQRVIDVCRERAGRLAERARELLTTAIENYERVIFATHYPPFEGATWHNGAHSNSVWLPWFSSKVMGDMLLEVAKSHPDRKILALCGHTHSSGVYDPLPNLWVLTGEAVYGAPEVAGVLDISAEGIAVSMFLRKDWRTLPVF